MSSLKLIPCHRVIGNPPSSSGYIYSPETLSVFSSPRRRQALRAKIEAMSHSSELSFNSSHEYSLPCFPLRKRRQESKEFNPCD